MTHSLDRTSPSGGSFRYDPIEYGPGSLDRYDLGCSYGMLPYGTDRDDPPLSK